MGLLGGCNKDTAPTTAPEPIAEAPAPEPAPEDPRAAHTRVCDEEGKCEVCTVLAVMYERGREGPENLEKAREYYEKGCEGDHELGCYNLALMLEKGHGGDPDPERSRALYLRTCEAELEEKRGVQAPFTKTSCSAERTSGLVLRDRQRRALQ
jgi:TPR repeat protein